MNRIEEFPVLWRQEQNEIRRMENSDHSNPWSTGGASSRSRDSSDPNDACSVIGSRSAHRVESRGYDLGHALANIGNPDPLSRVS